MKFSWCEDHGSWYHQTVNMVIISMYLHPDDNWVFAMIPQVVTMRKAIPLTHASKLGINFIVA